MAPGSEEYLVAAVVLLMLMLATYLLIKRGSVINIVAGVLLAVTAAFYGLTGGDLFWLGDGPVSHFLARALAFVGLG
jgi:hypothetical protein